ncbi:ADP-ribosylation factor 1 [Clavispora lusitaniae ATCC 42720]|uniref:ADP-ribosylation factor 1 n=1 Tax=Clavispora lusitaniae (strain ATCC 42720) TaxID=306902 RepID=C4Y177_CLAL4|nr:ADP-ribosylation factor 1 [Clavispora lusitaniae ATCC 42720]EEQ37837.1 ADP-ribosylation factor 1 [Clavispora lusitaniae ATCC 42720]
MQAQLLGDLRSVHGVWQILLVGKHKQQGVSQFVLVEHSLQLFSGLGNTVSVIGVHNENDTLCVSEVVSPQWSDLVLSTDIPNGEGNVLVLNGLDVETNSRNGGHNLTKLQLVQDGGLTSGVQADHQDSHFLVTKKVGKQLGERQTHSVAISAAVLSVKLKKKRTSPRKCICVSSVF